MSNFCLCVTILVSACSVVQSAVIPDGVLHMECRERYFMVTVDLSFTGEELRFEAVGENNVYPITEQYGAQHGYTVQVLPLKGLVELRASYVSLHTENKDDKMFMFRFNLFVVRDDEAVTYAMNETCFPSLPWSPREVTCEANYMEVNIRSDATCSSGTSKDDWNALKTVNGVPVEVVQVTIYSRQSWVVLMVDLVAACSMDVGLSDGIHMVWETPDMLYPTFSIVKVAVGLDGDLLDQLTAEEHGYMVLKRDSVFQIGVPFDADGRHRKSFVNDSLFEFYIFHLYFEQILLDEDQVETRFRLHRTMATVVQCPIFTENRTVLAEMAFTIYLGEVPEDVVLVAVHLNGESYGLPFATQSSHSITKVTYANNTQGYTLKVPFAHPMVEEKMIKEEAVLQLLLHIKFTLIILPENTTYFHQAAFTALAPHLSSLDIDASCLDSGISFTLALHPSNHPWQLAVCSTVLTTELAAQHGYIMSNNGQRLQLDVPLFTTGYTYNNATLKGFSGTFAISVQHPESSEVHSCFTKTCQFSRSEYILCSTNSWVTVTIDLLTVINTGVDPAGTHLLDKNCRPKETEGTRVQFSFSLNRCGTTVKVDGDTMTYENEIFFTELVSTSVSKRLMVRCSYPVERHPDPSSSMTFQADTTGIGTIVRKDREDHPTGPSAAHEGQRPLHINLNPIQQFLNHIRGEFDALYSKIGTWISENCLNSP
ncbi:uncharacterized protein LOC130522123 isoform X3 [Takifugu flavidus]|uniref:uncharacterized protein LOC130522123 isoform X3 n=1 Tax=Takifugu flavidus TaxID=433684 RepID=UPI0025441439|nr:uncharacterized protein LOC130522123 isoform X3 [Takifugu flavidus]